MVEIRVQMPPHAARRLSRMFTRMKTEGRDEAQRVTRGELRGVVHPSGVMYDRAVPPLVGDVTGTVGANTVGRLLGRLLSAVVPTIGQALVWSGTAWTPGTVVTGTHWEPIANGDPDDPQILFGADGDVLMTEVPD